MSYTMSRGDIPQLFAHSPRNNAIEMCGAGDMSALSSARDRAALLA
jgi:hypothetical protein